MIPIRIISLKSAADRRRFQEEQFTKLALPFLFLDATTKDDISKNTREKFANTWQRSLLDSEIACLLSHKAIWDKIVAHDQPMLILEDDVLLSPKLPGILAAVDGVTATDILQLETFARTKAISIDPTGNIAGRAIHRLTSGRAGSAAYILWPDGAKKLLLEIEKIMAPADAFINGVKSLRAVQIVPAPAIQFMQCHRLGLTPPIKSPTSISKTQAPEMGGSWLAFKWRRLKADIGRLKIERFDPSVRMTLIPFE